MSTGSLSIDQILRKLRLLLVKQSYHLRLQQYVDSPGSLFLLVILAIMIALRALLPSSTPSLLTSNIFIKINYVVLPGTVIFDLAPICFCFLSFSRASFFSSSVIFDLTFLLCFLLFVFLTCLHIFTFFHLLSYLTSLPFSVVQLSPNKVFPCPQMVGMFSLVLFSDSCRYCTYVHTHFTRDQSENEHEHATKPKMNTAAQFPLPLPYRYAKSTLFPCPRRV